MTGGILQYFKITKKIGSLILSITFFFSCGHEKPPVVMSTQAMVRALMEIYTTEQKVSNLKLTTDSSKIVFEKIKGQIFDRDGIKDSIFRKSFQYYVDRPKELELIYTAVVDSLNLKEQRLNMATLKSNSVKNDSLKADSIKKLK